MITNNRNWFRISFLLKYSVIPAILPRVIVFGLLGEFIYYLYKQGLPVGLSLNALVPGTTIVLSLLLVFRTNTAYERFWEGRKIWGSLVITARNLARQIWVGIQEKSPQDKNEKIAVLRLMVAFAVATKLYLRGEEMGSELEGLMSPSQHFMLKGRRTPPLEISFWIGEYLQEQYRRGCLSDNQLVSLQKLLDNIIEAFSGCERILQTPMPLPYAIHLKHLLISYCAILPFLIVKDVGAVTGLITALIAFTVFGIEQIGIAIENPFSRAQHNLPLDQMCNTMLTNMEDLSTLATNSAFAPTQLF